MAENGADARAPRFFLSLPGYYRVFNSRQPAVQQRRNRSESQRKGDTARREGPWTPEPGGVVEEKEEEEEEEEEEKEEDRITTRVGREKALRKKRR